MNESSVKGFFAGAITVILIFCFAFLYKFFPATANKVDYDAMCMVGKRYRICNKYDPFPPPHDVTIIDKKEGVVKYCYTSELNKSNKVYFVRSCKEFVEQVND